MGREEEFGGGDIYPDYSYDSRDDDGVVPRYISVYGDGLDAAYI